MNPRSWTERGCSSRATSLSYQSANVWGILGEVGGASQGVGSQRGSWRGGCRVLGTCGAPPFLVPQPHKIRAVGSQGRTHLSGAWGRTRGGPAKFWGSWGVSAERSPRSCGCSRDCGEHCAGAGSGGARRTLGRERRAVGRPAQNPLSSHTPSGPRPALLRAGPRPLRRDAGGRGRAK